MQRTQDGSPAETAVSGRNRPRAGSVHGHLFLRAPSAIGRREARPIRRSSGRVYNAGDPAGKQPRRPAGSAFHSTGWKKDNGGEASGKNSTRNG
jgi:hypothetical protein